MMIGWPGSGVGVPPGSMPYGTGVVDDPPGIWASTAGGAAIRPTRAHTIPLTNQ